MWFTSFRTDSRGRFRDPGSPDEETDAQRGGLTCLRSPGWNAGEPGVGGCERALVWIAQPKRAVNRSADFEDLCFPARVGSQRSRGLGASFEEHQMMQFRSQAGSEEGDPPPEGICGMFAKLYFSGKFGESRGPCFWSQPPCRVTLVLGQGASAVCASVS